MKRKDLRGSTGGSSRVGVVDVLCKANITLRYEVEYCFTSSRNTAKCSHVNLIERAENTVQVNSHLCEQDFRDKRREIVTACCLD